MPIKSEILEKYENLNSEKEIKTFLNELITALHDINENVLRSLVNSGYINEEQKEAKDEQVKALLRQIFESICKNVKLDELNKKSKAYEALKADRDSLASKVERAKEMLAEKDAEIEKTKKATQNELKKKLQIGRDKVVAIAETSAVLGSHIENPEAIDILNNIRDNVGLLTSEMISLGLWDEDDVKPNVEPIVVKVAEPLTETTDTSAEEEKPKKKTTRKTTKKVVEEQSDVESNDSLDDVDSLDDDLDEKNETKNVSAEAQISLVDVVEDNKQEE